MGTSPKQLRLCASDTVSRSSVSSSRTSPAGNEPNSAHELEEVTLVVSSVEPATVNTERRRFSRSLVPGDRTSTTTRRKQRALLDRTRFGAEKALHGLRFISNQHKGVDVRNKVQSNFDKLAKDGYLYRSDFAQCIVIEGTFGAEKFGPELFDALRRRRGLKIEKINKEEFDEYWTRIADQNFDSRLQIFFDMVDENEDGRITEGEVKEVKIEEIYIYNWNRIITLCAPGNELSGSKVDPEESAALIMEEFDLESLGYIELWQLETLFLQKDTYQDYSQELIQNLQRSHIQMLNKKLIYYVQDNWRRIWVLSVWLMIMIGLFTWKFFQYKQKNAFKVMGYCLPTAKGAAETLKFNMALILLPVCRNTITWLRSTEFNFFLPFDDNINFHKMIAAAILIGVVLHAGIHLTCGFPRLINASPNNYNDYLSRNFGIHKPTYLDLVKGPEGVTGILMVICMAIAFTLATKWFMRNQIRLPKPFCKLVGFNAFWYSHHLFFIVYILLIVHGVCLYLERKWYLQTTWMYIAFPVLLYVGERSLRFFRSCSYTVEVLKVFIYPGNVLKLQMSKPSQFRYKGGQYIFVQCPAVSSFEWHPFSITSAPNDDYLSIHIRTIGDWTCDLKRVFLEECERRAFGESGLLRADETTKESFQKLLIDGPFGGSTQNYEKYDVLLLIGLGIGVTLFISILKDLLNSIVKMEEKEDSNSYSNGTFDLSAGSSDSRNSSRVRPKKKNLVEISNAYLYWVTREQASFEWFKGVLKDISDLDQRRVIEMHNYLTSAYEDEYTRSTLTTMVQALNHANNGVDIFSGTRLRTHFAKPKWKQVFSELTSKHCGSKIGVFYCGSPMLVKELSKLCYEFNRKGSTKFEFHKEHF